MRAEQIGEPAAAQTRNIKSRPFKIILLGEGRCGKTSILLRFSKNEFSESQAPTTSASFLEKRINLDGESVVLSIWDTAGQEKYHSLGPIFYRDADAAIVVFDQSEPATFEKVQVWMSELRAMVDEPIPICIAGNKIDLTRGHRPDGELLKVVDDYAKQLAVRVFWTSALLNLEIEPMFLYLTRQVVANYKAAQSAGAEAKVAHERLELVAPPQSAAKDEEACC